MVDDPLATLTALPVSPFQVRVGSLPSLPGTPPTWRLEISEDNGGTWTSLDAGKPGQATPGAAILAGAQAITGWRAGRLDSSNAEIVFFLSQGKLEGRKILIDDPDKPGSKIQVDGYAALDSNGDWNEAVNPVEAINKAKAKPVKPLGAKP